jgi:hypothetical protein
MSARQEDKASQEIHFSRKFTRQIVAELFPAWQSLNGLRRQPCCVDRGDATDAIPILNAFVSIMLNNG